MFILPDLRQIQFQSVRHFFEIALPTEFKSIGNLQIISKKRFEFKIFGIAYKLERPRFNDRECVHRLITYGSNVYVPAYFFDKVTKKIRKETLWLGSIPLIDSTGTFVINGISRCVVNQILRTPGIYYTLNVEGIYIATIICNSGRRLRLELDMKGNIYVRITRRCKISIVLLLYCMGLNINDIPLNLTIGTKQINEFLSNIDEAKKKLQRTLTHLLLRQLNKKTKQTSNFLWANIFTIPYDLGQVGRLNFNKTLYAYETSPIESSLLPKDIILAAECLIKGVSSTLHVDDIDELGNKYVKSVGDVMHEQLKISLEDLKDKITKRISEISSYTRLPSPRKLVGATPLTITFNQFFGSYALSQFLDQTNPLSDMVHKRRLSSLGPGGLTTRTATFRARDIHPSQYGRICPVETAEGQNAGVVTSFTVSTEMNSEGVLKSPVYSVGSHNVHIRELITQRLSPREDGNSKVATGTLLSVVNNLHDTSTTPAQYRRDFVSTPWSQIRLRNILPIHYFSVGVSLIPFLEHDDATRALMGSNMQRQAVPLINPEKPVVGTGLEGQIALDSGNVMTATQDGKILHVEGQSISILHVNPNINSETKISNTLLLNFERSNNSTCMHQRPLVKSGEFIQRGQILADGAGTVGGELALGKNVLVAYMPWEGYNFEDAVLISERLLCEDIFTSLHIEKYELEAHDTVEGSEIITKDIPHLKKYLLRHLDNEGIVSLGAWVKPGDVLVGKLTPQEPTGPHPENKLLQAIFGSEAVKTRDTSLKVPPRAGGRVINIRWVLRDSNTLRHNKMINISILQKRKIQVGDKVAGRHGNKGIVSRILSRQDMPYLQDGTPVDMVLSPLGVPSRMNVGQVLECLLGLAGGYLKKHYRIMPFDERYERGASRKLVSDELYHSSQMTGFPWLFEYNSPGKSRLFDGRTGEMFEQPVTVGRAYMFKLIHQADDKIHARSTGPYAMVTQQPLRGKSRQGGQRVGEMEVWALQGFGAAHVLQEMLLIKSDHIIARSDAFTSITTGKPIQKTVGPQDSLRLLIRELRCLGIKINHTTVCKRSLVPNTTNI